MRKKLLVSLVAASGIVASAAMAEVTLYGEVGARLDVLNKDAATKNTDVTKTSKPGSQQVNFSDSEVGVKGGFDVNTVTSVFYQGEWNISDATMRDSFVGIKGGGGHIKIGKNTGLVDGYTGLSPISGAKERGALAKYNLTGRYDSIVYQTPSFNGFVAHVQYTPGQGAETNGYQAGFKYSNAMFEGGVSGAAHTSQDTDNDTETEKNNMKAYATVSLDAFKVGLSYATGDQTTDTYAAGVKTVSGEKEQYNAYYLTTSVAMTEQLSAGLLYGAVNTKVGETKVSSDGTHVGVGLNYQIADSTKAYFSYSQLKHKNGTKDGADDTKPNALSIGVVHGF